MTIQYLKLEIFIPATHFRILQKALQSVDAGHIGNYDSCLSYSPVKGTWRPLEGTTPYIGKKNEISEEEEYKVEVTIKKENLEKRWPLSKRSILMRNRSLTSFRSMPPGSDQSSYK